MLRIAVTGGIASGKTTLCSMLAAHYHLPLFDADAVVRRLYDRPYIQEHIATAFPVIAELQGRGLRKALSQYVAAHPEALLTLEAILHPSLRLEEKRFTQLALRQGRRAALYDIPLLCETGSAARYDLRILVTAPLWLRRSRALKRGNMSEATLERILSRQWGDEQKRRCVDVEIPSSLGRAHSWRLAAQVMQLVYDSVDD